MVDDNWWEAKTTSLKDGVWGFLLLIHTLYNVMKLRINKKSFFSLIIENSLFGLILLVLHLLYYVTFQNVLVVYEICLLVCGMPQLYLFMCLAHRFLIIKRYINQLTELFSDIK